MNYQSETLFKNQPSISTTRTIIPMGHDVKFTFNAAQFVPFDVQKVLPGDTFSYQTSLLLRTSTPLTPTMDNAFVEIAHFFVPERQVWDHAKEYRGENTAEPDWEDQPEYEKPTIEAPTEQWYLIDRSVNASTSGTYYVLNNGSYEAVTLPDAYDATKVYYRLVSGWKFGTIADYMGITPGVGGLKVDALPFRANAHVWNNFYRDQNLQKSIPIDKGDSNVIGTNGDNYLVDAALGGMPLTVCKYRDVFTTCLPEPQKGPEALLPLGVLAPVITGDPHNSNTQTLTWQNMTTNETQLELNGIGIDNNRGGTFAYNPTYNVTDWRGYVTPGNLYANLENATAASINEVRNSVVVQHILERNARSGTRFREIINAAYGVRISSQTDQIPEYLGGKRIPINMNQVVQTSQSTDGSPQGSTAAFSLTVSVDETFTKSFEEWGYILTYIYVRNENTYQDGVERQWFEINKWDEYDPAMANIGMQPVKNREIFAQGNSEDEEIFGWQQAWYNYRYRTDRVAGEFRSKSPKTLDFWHYADDYNKLPTLGPDWIKAQKTNIDRTLAVSSELANQFHCDFKFDKTAVRVMPIYSIPGLERI